MSVNELLRTALLPMCDEVVADVYVGDADTYIVFNYTTHGADYADDTPGHELYLIQVHFYCPRTFDSTDMKKEIKNALFAIGCTWPAVIPASDEDGQHLVFECEYVSEV